VSQLLSVCNPSGSRPGWLPGTSYGGARPRLFVGNVRVELTPAAYRSSAPCALNPDPGAGIAAALHCANLPHPVPEASRSGTALNQGIKEVRECSLSNRRTPLCGSASLVRCRLHCTPARNRVHRLERLDYAASPSALQANQSSRNHTKLNTCTTSNLLPIEATRPRLPWPGASRISGPSFFPARRVNDETVAPDALLWPSQQLESLKKRESAPCVRFPTLPASLRTLWHTASCLVPVARSREGCLGMVGVEPTSLLRITRWSAAHGCCRPATPRL